MGSRIVFDTNVLISSVGWDAKPEICLERALYGPDEGYISPDLLDELKRVLEYPHLDITEQEGESFVEIILASFHMIVPQIDLEVIEDDPDDDMVLECAVAADASYIISGDSHLQGLESFREINIVSPAVFLEEHEANPNGSN